MTMLCMRVLALCLTAALIAPERALPQGPPDRWTSLDNPRNRDLFFRTLQAYFIRRGVDVAKAPGRFPGPTGRGGNSANSLYGPDPVKSAFTDYQDNKDAFTAFLQG
ncbi:uncharacterized protein C2orf66-like [Amia ocellicauda]|uniref:uncharacterized protein C2orf66-like n=1 Tax=Amia ocellicauda TaxID=2972642 RepID=UPI0034643982